MLQKGVLRKPFERHQTNVSFFKGVVVRPQDCYFDLKPRKIIASMQITFNARIAEQYKNPSQKARVLSETWVGQEVFCPSCGTNINHYENNRPVADFFCPKCLEEYELKSKQNSFGNRVVDGDYRDPL